MTMDDEDFGASRRQFPGIKSVCVHKARMG
jgi:hypothetical protein